MNLAEMRTMLRRKCGDPSSADVSDADLNGHLNNAIEEIVDKYPFLRGRARYKFTTTLGASKYHIDSKTDTVLKVWDRTQGKRLTKVDANYVADNDNDNVQRGKPLNYARFGTYIQILPPPDGEYVIEFWCRILAATLSLDGDIPALPRTWHRGVVIYATYMFYSDQKKDQTKASFHYNEFSVWAKSKPVEVQEELTDLDQGVVIPTLSSTVDPREDFDHSD